MDLPLASLLSIFIWRGTIQMTWRWHVDLTNHGPLMHFQARPVSLEERATDRLVG